MNTNYPHTEAGCKAAADECRDLASKHNFESSRTDVQYAAGYYDSVIARIANFLNIFLGADHADAIRADALRNQFPV